MTSVSTRPSVCLSALLFCLIGAAAWLQNWSGSSRPRFGDIAAVLSVLVLGASVVVIFGTAYGLPFWSKAAHPGLPLLLALSFASLSHGWLLTAGPEAWLLRPFADRSLRARLLRMLLPAVLFMALIEAWLVCVVVPYWVGSNVVAAGLIMVGHLLLGWVAIYLLTRAVAGPVDQAGADRIEEDVELRRLRRRVAVLAHAGRCAASARSRDELAVEICRVLVEEGGLRGVAVGQHDVAARLVKMLGCHGQACDLLDRTVITTDEGPAGQGPTGTAVRENRTAVCHDFHTDPRVEHFREVALRHGIRSGAAIPLRMEGKIWGALSAYSTEAGWFDDDEVALLTEVANVLACVLTKLEVEARRREVEAAWRVSEQRFQGLARKVPGVIYQFRVAQDGTPFHSYISPRAAESGLSTDPAHPDWHLGQRIHPADRDRFFATVAKSIMERTDFHFEGRGLLPNGEVRWVRATSALTVCDGELVYDGVLTDITDQKRAEEILRNTPANSSCAEFSSSCLRL